MRNVLSTIGKSRWAFPFILLAVGYLIPAAHVPVGWPESGTLWAVIAFSLIAMIIWLWAENLAVVNRYTTSRELQRDDAVSLAIALVLTYVAGELRQAGHLQWWYIIPWLGAVLDSFFAGYLAINNAAQKPFAPHEKTPYQRPISS